MDKFGYYRIKVVDAPKCWGQLAAADATTSTFLIRVSKGSRNRFTLLHELSHIVTRRHGHGSTFIKNYLTIVKNFYPRVHSELRKSFRKAGFMVP